MNSKLLMVATGIIFLAACNVPKENEMKWFDRAVNTSGHQLLYMAEKLKNEPDTLCFPRSLKDGKYRLEKPLDWTSGFSRAPCGWRMSLQLRRNWQNRHVCTLTVWKRCNIIRKSRFGVYDVL